jgi:predicted NUDIX family NTP pyrophosphohydrolase
MAKPASAGLLCYRRDPDGGLEVLLAHPGGPFFARKDAGAWGIPKGIVNEGEDLLMAARREFAEEIGWTLDEEVSFLNLGSIRMKSGKIVHAWAFESDRQVTPELSGTSVFTLEWPPRSGRRQTFQEIDRAEFFALSAAMEKIIEAQKPFLERLVAILASSKAGGRLDGQK